MPSLPLTTKVLPPPPGPEPRAPLMLPLLLPPLLLPPQRNLLRRRSRSRPSPTR